MKSYTLDVICLSGDKSFFLYQKFRSIEKREKCNQTILYSRWKKVTLILEMVKTAFLSQYKRILEIKK